jgi:hypothetical protein
MFFWITLAQAGIPLVYQGESEAVVLERGVTATGLPESQFDLVPLEQLLKAPPNVEGQAVLRHCAGAGTKNSVLKAHAVRAEAAWSQGNISMAMDELDLGIGGLGCLMERVERETMSRMFLLRGGLLARQGKLEEARAELQSACSIDTTTSWPGTFPEEGAVLFAEVLSAPERIALTIMPAGSGALPAIDGQSVGKAELFVRPGLHLLQLPGTSGLKSAWLTVEGTATLIVPANYREPILPRLIEENPEVETLLLSSLSVEAVYVATEGCLYLVARGETEPQTTLLVAPPRPPPEETSKKPKKQRSQQ